MRFQRRRREFLARAARAAALTSAFWPGIPAGTLASLLSPARASAAAARPRRHLINLVGWGGWESAWLHSAMELAPLQAAMNAADPEVWISENLADGFEDEKFGRAYKLTRRFDESQTLELGQWNHSQGRRPQLGGSAFRSLFASGPVTKADLCIVKGLQQEGQHTLGNFAINQGSNSSYAKGFSGIVAGHLGAADYVRPLHHALLAESPGQLFIQQAMLKGSETPVCISGLDIFKSVTTVDTTVLSEAQAKRVQKTAGGLAELLVNHKGLLKSGVEQASGLALSQSASGQIATSRWGDSVELKAAMLRYRIAILRALRDVISPHNSAANGFPLDYRVGATVYSDYTDTVRKRLAALEAAYTSGLQDKIHRLRLKLGSATELAALRTELTTALNGFQTASDAADSTTLAGHLGPEHTSSVGALAYNFGMADFLVREDIAAVVDLKTVIEDEHWRWMRGLSNTVATFAAFRELIASLKEVPMPDGSSLFDHTLIIAHTELDREFHLQTPDNGPGTNHGLTASAVLAGYRCNMGRVIGDVSMGKFNPPELASREFGAPLPIDPATGVPAPSGKVFNVRSILPTVVELFGAKVPLQQESEHRSIPAVTRS